jgi:hypothetical protein
MLSPTGWRHRQVHATSGNERTSTVLYVTDRLKYRRDGTKT